MPGKVCSLFLAVLALTVAGSVHARQPRVAVGGDETSTGFGRAVALANEEMFIGEPFNVLTPGAVYVFAWDAPSGSWIERGRLTASDAVAGDRFGQAVAVDGDRLLVGAPFQVGSTGAAYIFERDATTGAWVEQAKLTARDGVAPDLLGEAVALHGNTALVGASFRNTRAGAAYVFERDEVTGAWTEQTRLVGHDTQPGDRFGFAVALWEDHALIGAYAHNNQEGAVYAFWRDATERWAEQAKLVSPQVQPGDRFGYALAFREDEAVVGAPRHGGFLGAVFVTRYDSTSGRWIEQARLTPGTGRSGDRFGRSVSGDGETLWVGAPFADGAVGAVFAFERDAVSGDWLERARLTGPGLEFGDLFGWAVGVSGTHAVAGVAGEDFGAGSAFVYEQNAGSGTWVNAGPLIGSDEGLAAVVGARVVCANGMAVSFPCRNADLLAFLPTSAIGGARGAGVNDLWGWTDPETGMEVAIVGRSDGTSFVDVSDPVHPVFLGNLLTHSEPSSWRDVKVHADHAFIVSEAPEHGMQVFDLTQLRAVVNPPVTFGETAHYAAFSSAHNIVVNEESGFAYVVGANSGGETCGGGLHMVNIQDPVNPLFMGCFADPTTGRAGTGYTHDAQCVIYHGPDVEHRGREICIGSNETAVSIADVTDKSAPVALSTATYPAASYIHQGWLTEDHRYFFQDDELDELRQSFSRTRTYIWDLADLDDPQLLAEYEGTTPSADHNQYVVGSYVFQSNYASGLRILDISDVARPVEVASFDVFPPHDAAGFNGSWSNYPFFESGTVIVSGREAGLFIVEPTGIQVRPPLEPPASFALQAAYPNPFTDRTSITVMLPDEQPLSLVAYDVLGREVARLYEGTLPAGTYVFPFEAADLAGGTYFVRAKGTGKMQTQVVILIR